MKIYIFAVLVLLLSACATTGTEMQAECETQFRKFPDIYRCTYDAVAKRNPAILKDSRAKLYLLRGEQLAQEVDDGKTSNIDAKVLWQKSYVELKTGKDQEILASVDAMSRSLEAKRAASLTTQSADIVESQIDGEFSGWEGETIFKLTNGQIWQQSSYAYAYSYKYRPKVLIFPTNGGFELQVEGMDQRIKVVRIL